MGISLFHASAFAFFVSFVSFNCCAVICCVAGVVVVGGVCGISALICCVPLSTCVWKNSMKQKLKLKCKRSERKDEKYATMTIKRRQVEQKRKIKGKKRGNEEKTSLERDQE